MPASCLSLAEVSSALSWAPSADSCPPFSFSCCAALSSSSFLGAALAAGTGMSGCFMDRAKDYGQLIVSTADLETSLSPYLDGRVN